MAVVPRIVVIGAGFGGLEVARHLKGAPVEVTLVDQHNFHTFQPLLYQVATAGLNAADVAHVVRGLFHRQPNVRFRQGQVTGVDWDARAVTVDGPSRAAVRPPRPRRRGHRHLLRHPRRGRPRLPALHAGGRRRACGTTSSRRFEAADADPTELDRRRAHLRGGRRRAHRRRDRRRHGRAVRRGLPQGLPGPRREPRRASSSSRCRTTCSTRSRRRSRRHALDTLAAAGSRSGWAPRSPPWRPTTSPSPTARSSPARRSCGRRACRPTRWPRRSVSHRIGAAEWSWAPTSGCPTTPTSGPSATSRPPRDRRGDLLPQLAPVAMQSGRHVARQIRRQLQARPTEPFRYLDKGTMATIGRRAAVAELPGGIRLRGGLAWLAWLGLHLVFLVGKRNRAVGAPQLGLELRHLGPRPPPHPRSPRPLTASVCAHHRDAVLSAHRTWQVPG